LLNIKGGRGATALFALLSLLLSLVATVAHNPPQQAQASSVVELCTEIGIQLVSLDADGKPIEAPGHRPAFCPICLANQIGSSYIAPAPIDVLRPAPVVVALVDSNLWSAYPEQDWALPHLPRAPPTLG
jgi:hypothetical protein